MAILKRASVASHFAALLLNFYMAPTISRSVKRRLETAKHISDRCDFAAQCFWELEHGKDSPPHHGMSELCSSDFQKQNIRNQIRMLGKPPMNMTPRGAFLELQGQEDYAGGRCDLASLDVGKLSIPEMGLSVRFLRCPS